MFHACECWSDGTTMALFNLKIDSNTRVKRYKILKERPRLEVRKYSFFFQVTDPWTSHTNQMVEAPTVDAFETVG